jgi:hypothetical protein
MNHDPTKPPSPPAPWPPHLSAATAPGAAILRRFLSQLLDSPWFPYRQSELDMGLHSPLPDDKIEYQICDAAWTFAASLSDRELSFFSAELETLVKLLTGACRTAVEAELLNQKRRWGKGSAGSAWAALDIDDKKPKPN